jgi:hypothetical protein
MILVLSLMLLGGALNAAGFQGQGSLISFDVFGSILSFFSGLINALARIVAPASISTTVSTTIMQTTIGATTAVSTASTVVSTRPTTSTNQATVTSAMSTAPTSSVSTSTVATSATTTIAYTSTVSTASSSIPPTTSIAPGNGTSQGGDGSGYFSEDQAIALVDSGGRYSALYVANPSLPNSVLNNNVTGYWLVSYEISGYSVTKIMYEFAYLSSKAHLIYTVQLPKFLANETVVADNATLGGMTYSYITWNGTSSRGSEIIGYKNGEFVEVVAPYETDPGVLATVIANDIP